MPAEQSLLEKIVLVAIPASIVVMGSLLIYFLNKRDKTIDAIKDSITQLIATFKSDTKELRNELKTDIKDLKDNMKSDHEYLRDRIDSHIDLHLGGKEKDGDS